MAGLNNKALPWYAASHWLLLRVCTLSDALPTSSSWSYCESPPSFSCVLEEVNSELALEQWRQGSSLGSVCGLDLNLGLLPTEPILLTLGTVAGAPSSPGPCLLVIACGLICPCAAA